MGDTNLYWQLKKLETPQTSLYLHKKTTASILFTPKDAAKHSFDEFYTIGLEGLEDLIKLDNEFKPFKYTLFDITSKHFQRTVESYESNQKLNQNIKKFMLLLSPYFLFKCAHKALEWLIHRFLIHQFNINEVMLLILPYHESMLFIQVVQILDLKQDKSWHWLENIKKAGVPLSKLILFKRILDNASFLKFVANMPVAVIKECRNISSFSTLFIFYCSSMIGSLQKAGSVTDLNVTFLLPSLLTCLSSNHPDAISAAFMIIGYLSTKAQLSEKVVHVFFKKLSGIQCEKLYNEATILMILLSQNISKEIKFPQEALNNLKQSQWFLPNLKIASNKSIVVIPFLTCILESALTLIIKGNELMIEFVNNLLKMTYIDHSDAEEIFNCLLEQFNEQSTPNIKTWYADLLRQLKKSFPNAFDVVVSKVTKMECPKAAALNHLLGVSNSRLDLYESLVHPNEHIREKAVCDIIQKNNTEELGWINQSLLERFNDDCANVIIKLLQPSSFLKNVPPAQLFEKLVLVITKFESNVDILELAVPMLLDIASEEDTVVKILVTVPVLFQMNADSCISSTTRNKIIQHLKIKDTTVFDFFNNPESLPSVSECLKALNSFKHMSNNYKYWFITALMIAGNLPKKCDLSTLKSIACFIEDYCKHPQLCAHKIFLMNNNSGLMRSIKALKNGLPLEGAIYCTMALTKTYFNLENCNQNWIDFSISKNECFLTIFKIIYLLPKQKRRNSRVQYFDSDQFIKNIFPCTEIQINFLLNTLIYDEIHGKILIFVKDILEQLDLDFKRKFLEQSSVVVPTLLILLSSTNSSIRKNVMHIIKLLMDNSDPKLFYHQFVVELYNFREELIMDHEQIVVFAFVQLSPAKEVRGIYEVSKRKYAVQVLNEFLNIILCSDTPMYIKVRLLQIFEHVESTHLFQKLKPLATALQDKDKQNEDESRILLYILKRFNSNITECLFTDEETWEFLVKGLADHTSEVKGVNLKQATCPAAILLDQISTDIYDSVPNPRKENQEKLLLLILTSIMDAESIDVTNASAKLFKRISLNCDIAVSLLTPMLTIDVEVPRKEAKKKKLIPSFKILETNEWKRGVCLLEQIQTKKKLTSVPLLLPVLFNILKRCLQFEEQGPVEYTKQLILSTILNCSENITKNQQILSQDMWQVDIIVNCLRASHNPQTHHHALIALTHLARVVPDKVLNDIMSIFTFIGSTVIRQDDTYTYQIITNIIDSIIPILVETKIGSKVELNMTNVCRVFATALLDIPEHRKVSTIFKLMSTLNNGEYLWLFLCLIFENHVLRSNVPPSDLMVLKPIETSNMPKSLETAMQVCLEFPLEVFLTTCLKLLQHLNSLPVDKDGTENMDNELILAIFNVQQNSGKQFRHYKYSAIMFLSSLLSSQQFIQRVADLSEEEHFLLTDIFEKLLEQTLKHLKMVLNQVEICAQNRTAKYWRVILNHIYDILDKINALLPIKLFLQVIKQLMNNEVEAIRRKSLEIFGWRLQQSRPIPQNTLFELLQPLMSLLDAPDLKEPSQENQLTMQAVLFALKLMTRHLGNIHTKEFIEILVKVSEIFRDANPSNWTITGSLALCIGELVSVLQEESLPYLPNFMETLIQLLDIKKYEKDGVELILISAVIALQKVVDNMLRFISPYLIPLLHNICSLSGSLNKHQFESQKSVSGKLNSLRQKLTKDTPKRIVLPAVTYCFEQFATNGDFNAIVPLMLSLSDGEITNKSFNSDMEVFFIQALSFRAKCNLPLETINLVEDAVIESLIIFVMKLTETSFSSFFNKLANTENHTRNAENAITFYRVCYNLSEALRSLISLFASTIIQNSSAMLETITTSLINDKARFAFNSIQSGLTDTIKNLKEQKQLAKLQTIKKNTLFDKEFSVEKSCLLIDSIIKALLSMFTYDPEKSLSSTHLFPSLLNHLIMLVPFQIGGVSCWQSRCETILIPCLAKMVRSISDDSQWRMLNKKVLLLTRHPDPLVRIVAVKAIYAIAKELNEEFLPLLPETTPYLAELLEDDNPEVEAACRNVVLALQDVTAEEINLHF